MNGHDIYTSIRDLYMCVYIQADQDWELADGMNERLLAAYYVTSSQISN